MGIVSASAVFAAILCSRSVPLAAADDLKIDTRHDILKSSRSLAGDLVSLYNGDKSGGTPGLLPTDEYYWWESGAFMGSLVDYWHLTGDETYNDAAKAGLLWQAGKDKDYMPANQSRAMANDDQCFWGIAAIQAAEDGFPDPPEDEPRWLALAQAVFDTQTRRLDDKCGGGLHWQIMQFNAGYGYKNSISSGCLFNLGARLARYTGNTTYADTATELWDWLSAVGFIDDQDSWNVYDGAEVASNCSDVDQTQFSNTAAILTHGAAFMYNQTDGSNAWRTRVEKLLDSLLDTFFPNDVAVEVSCERDQSCSTDVVAYKGLTLRWLAGVSQLAPFTADAILPVLNKSAQAAVKHCTDSKSGWKCGFYWTEDEPSGSKTDDPKGVGEKMDALAAVSNLLITDADAPATGSSKDSGHGARGGDGQGTST